MTTTVTEGLIVSGKEPREIIPMMLDALGTLGHRGREGADWIEDVYSEVLFELRQDNVSDPEMVKWLLESVITHLTQLAPLNLTFRERRAGDGQWGFWGPLDEAEADV